MKSAQSAAPWDHPWLRDYSRLPNFGLQQCAWWACVLWMGWLGPGVMALFLCLHFWVTRSAWRAELPLVVLSVLLGTLLDNLLAEMGLVSYVGELRVGESPFWLVAIWAGFGATLRHSQRTFVDATYKALLTGLLGGPLAYLGGEKLERVVIDKPAGLVGIALLWVAVMVSLSLASRALELKWVNTRDASGV